MAKRTLLITGGAGFVGSYLALTLKNEHPSWDILVLDSLKRRGSELNLPRLKKAGVRFYHGDIRCPEDFATLPPADTLLECSAEPSVLAGYGSAADYVVQTNLFGTVNCLNYARRHKSDVIFLSTSRVYPFTALNALPYVQTPSRFDWLTSDVAGHSPEGIAENFSLEGPKSLYGATKLASEILVTEYASTYGLRTVINRCGVLAGPWQMGKTDQGILALWVLKHLRAEPLSYIGFGGAGKQVRDILHVADLARLIQTQVNDPAHWNGGTFNVGGGMQNAVSLRELTRLCESATGKKLRAKGVSTERAGDVRVYVTDNGRVRSHAGWKPRIPVSRIVEDTARWARAHRRELESCL